MPASALDEPSHLVTVAWLNEHAHDSHVRILDARLPESFAEAHIPQAVHVDLISWRYTRHGVDGMLIEPDDFAVKAGQLGISQDTLVVIYDDYFGQIAARIAWSLLDMGIPASRCLQAVGRRGRPPGCQRPQKVQLPEPASFVPEPVDSVIAEHDWVKDHLAAPGIALLDVRSPAEYAKGHLPNAISWNWELGTDVESTFRPAAEVMSELAALGITPDKEIITYCQSGMRAAHTYFLLLNLGFKNVRMYDGSWAEWSHKEGNPLHAS